VIDAPLALGFTAGLLAVVNPCGFAMLPAYLSYFVIGDGTIHRDTVSALRRALVVGIAVSSGFAALFALIALVVRHLTDRVLAHSPWVSVVIGVALAVFGAALAAGREVRLRIPRLDRGGGSGAPVSMALYGASYGIVSLGCTLPTFLVYVAGTLTRESFGSGTAVFGAYALGFATLLTGLTVAMALARQSLVRELRRVLPYVERLSGLLLVLAGLYVAYFGWYELHSLGEPDPIIDRVTGLSADIQQLVQDVGALRVGAVLAIPVAAAALLVVARRRAGRTSDILG
jgi:cytochrome c-type biogenesis protein